MFYSKQVVVTEVYKDMSAVEYDTHKRVADVLKLAE